jgi:hypothetical protein
MVIFNLSFSTNIYMHFSCIVGKKEGRNREEAPWWGTGSRVSERRREN